MKFLSFSIGNLVNYSTICQNLRIDYKTLESYLSILEQTYITIFLSPFFKNIVTELRKAKKIYFLDTGLRNSILNDFSSLEGRYDFGKLLENFVFIQLRNYFEKLNFWRTTGKAEIDFILTLNSKIIPIEVKCRDFKLSRGFISFIKAYKPEFAIVFTFGKFGVEKINSTKVAFIPHYFI